MTPCWFMKVFFARIITKSAIGCSYLLLFIDTLNNTQFENFSMCLQIFIHAFRHFRWLGWVGANDPDFSVDLSRSRATFCTTEILYIFHRNCYTSQGDPDSVFHTSLEVVFQEQSYSSLNSGWSLAWDHFRSDIADPCCVIANFCRVIADPCGIVAIPEVIGSRLCGDANHCMTH